MDRRMGCLVLFSQYCIRCYPFQQLREDRIYWRHLPPDWFHYSVHPNCSLLKEKSSELDFDYERFHCFEPILKSENYDTESLWKNRSTHRQWPITKLGLLPVILSQTPKFTLFDQSNLNPENPWSRGGEPSAPSREPRIPLYQPETTILGFWIDPGRDPRSGPEGRVPDRNRENGTERSRNSTRRFIELDGWIYSIEFVDFFEILGRYPDWEMVLFQFFPVMKDLKGIVIPEHGRSDSKTPEIVFSVEMIPAGLPISLKELVLWHWFLNGRAVGDMQFGC